MTLAGLCSGQGTQQSNMLALTGDATEAANLLLTQRPYAADETHAKWFKLMPTALCIRTTSDKFSVRSLQLSGFEGAEIRIGRVAEKRNFLGGRYQFVRELQMLRPF